MPVGRFVLDVHGEEPARPGRSDALCAALQIINHLQDCGNDYRALDRVYLPLDALAAHGVEGRALGASAATPGCARCLADARRAHRARCSPRRAVSPLASPTRASRLEIAVILGSPRLGEGCCGGAIR